MIERGSIKWDIEIMDQIHITIHGVMRIAVTITTTIIVVHTTDMAGMGSIHVKNVLRCRRSDQGQVLDLIHGVAIHIVIILGIFNQRLMILSE
jgi:hypothetical protein